MRSLPWSVRTSSRTASRATRSHPWSGVRRSSSRAIATLLVTRAVMEAIAFACLLAVAQTAGGAAPLALTPATLGLVGTTLVLVAALREIKSEKRGTAIVVTTLLIGVVLAIVLPAHRLDVVGWGGRVIAFAILAEIYLWRVVSLARGGVRWSDARNAAPFAATALAPFLRPVIANIRPNPTRTPEEDEALLREIERTRPFVIGGLEIVIIVFVILVALVLLERAVRERRIAMPDGAELERGSVDGLSLGETLRGLFPHRLARRRQPRDDGSASAALRVVYWRFLALAERAGHGWRVTAETPAEHQRRLAGADARWEAATPIVAAFEDLRYGEVAPDHATVSRARAVLRALEVAVRT